MHQSQENLSFIFSFSFNLNPLAIGTDPPPPAPFSFFWKPIFFLSLHKKNKYLAMQSQFFSDMVKNYKVHTYW